MPRAFSFIFCLSLFAWLALPSNSHAKPDHVVLAYVPSYRDALESPADFNYDAVTHLARAFIREKEDGSLTIPADYFNATLEKLCREHDVKLLVSVGGGATEAAHWQPLAHDPQHVKTFIDALAKLMDEHHYDGIDIDFEPPPANDADGKDCAGLMAQLHNRFPNSILTFTISGSEKGTSHLPLDQIAGNVSFINAMTYSYATPTSGLASFNANLHADPQGAHTRHSVEEGIAAFIKTHQVPPEKLLMGINFWESRFHVDHLGDSYPPRTKGYADNIEYPRVMDLLGTGRYTNLRDTTADAAYMLRTGGGCVVTYEDPQSIKAKCELVKKLNCAGVIIWHIGADLGSGQTPLLSAVAESFGMQPLPISRAALESEITRLSKKPIPPNSTLDSLLKLDTQLRTARGIADDDKWTASTPGK